MSILSPAISQNLFFPRSCLGFVFMLCAAVYSIPGWAADEALQPRIEVNGRGGTKRSILMTEAWMPLAQDRDQVIYSDIRYMGDEFDNQEGNFGVGYRKVSTDLDAVVGVHGWIDRRQTDRGSLFYQATTGVEVLGRNVDGRVNVYIPMSGEKTYTTPNTGSTTPYLADTGIYYDTNGRLAEEAQSGFDAELGYRLPVLEKHMDSFRVYAGAYAFRGDHSDNVTGWRTRAEANVNQAFSIGARFQHDEPRGYQGFLEATLRFPFAAKKSFRSEGLRARLDESPERDIDIVTGTQVLDTGLKKPVVNTESGTVQRILYVDNTNAQAGNGSKENPFSTLASAQAALKANDILYVYHGDGTTTGMDHGITIDKSNVSLIGSGSALTYNGYTLLAAGSAPVITNTESFLSDGDIAAKTSYSGNGVFVTSGNVSISGIEITNAGANGLYVLSENAGNEFGTVTITNVISHGNNGRGIMVYARNGGSIDSVEIFSSISSANTQTADTLGRGIEVRSQGTDSLISHTDIKDNQVFNNSNYGILTYANTGIMQEVNVFENLSYSNMNANFVVQANNSGRIGNVNFSQNQALSAITNYGFLTSVTANSIVENISIIDNYFTGNANLGVNILANNGYILKGILSGNTISGNGVTTTSGGLRIASETSSASIDNFIVENNIIKNNVGYGAYITRSTTSSILNVDLGGGSLGSVGLNNISNNTGREIVLNYLSLSAQNNYWGGANLPLAELTLNNGATIDASNWLTSAP